MLVEYVFDTGCPWCLIGKRRFQRALKKRPSLVETVKLRPFVLSPNLPRGGQSWESFLEGKFGEPGKVARVLQAVGEAAAEVGVHMRFDLITRVPNTVDSHRLVRLGETPEQRDALVEALFRAFFEEGRDLTLTGTLVDIGEEQGLERDVVEKRLRSADDVVAVLMESNQCQSRGVRGVPGFIFNRSVAISGAQEEEVFLRMLDTASDLSGVGDPAAEGPGPTAGGGGPGCPGHHR
ncbi:DsbA family oxidoreductase [Phaeovibrio sulfidiphilus]|uniref:DsbA family oxidoreductase n=1 Tax=Phaeovibrio sulfidiphilus TaxID=1220600 RepID=A0A8J6YQ19_9PROT|nr:DsbA family oxidoreductase [Phaeovibrio sulfidiphilus]MBE1237601.1 DsbA family oxidoreductase [Phaeovibrio sulfidiphilus]